MKEDTNSHQIIAEIKSLSNESRIDSITHFFRADKGDICEGDKFLAIKIPELRRLVKKYSKLLQQEDLGVFFKSEYNEIRFFAQQIVVEWFKKYYIKHDIDGMSQMQDLLIVNIKSINHWNLTDAVSLSVFGKFALTTGDCSVLNKLINDQSIWHKRIAIGGCFPLVKREVFDLPLSFLKQEINHPHEYIQKANGWLLREIGIKNEKILIEFLLSYWTTMPSVTKSYAGERLRKTYNLKSLFS